MKTIGICAHSYEGAALCYLTACKQGSFLLGEHMHPNIVLSSLPMGPVLPAWESGDDDPIIDILTEGVVQTEKAGADFFICPDNTAHLVLEKIITELPLPGLHIADVVCDEIQTQGWNHIGLLGTKWTMNGSVYKKALKSRGMNRLVPEPQTQKLINTAIFEELCQGVFTNQTELMFIEAINDLKLKGADCVILGCTEIPLIINNENSPLPILDSTRLLGKKAVEFSIQKENLPKSGWISI